ncbi:hypothetical protein D6D04_04624 [Aureobasidium pullulans]|nr:hypothetical protein D6D04_04624 [Aureobasidium pullulans]
MSIPSGIPATSSSTGTSTSRPVVSTSTRSDGGTVVYSISYITQTPTQVTVSVTVLTTTTITAPSSQSTVYSTTVITTTPTTVEASSTTAVVAPTLQAKCVVWWDVLFYKFMVYGIDGWAFDYGKALHKQEDGCAALTGWTWHNATDTEYAYAYFNLPLVFKAGCVERAIVSAGGPKLACKGLPNIAQRSIQAEMLLESEETMLAELRSQEKARAAESLVLAASLAELERRAQKTDPPIQQDSFTPSYSYSTTLTSSQSYVPMNWTGYGDTITLTWMVTETFPPTTYTTSVPVTKTIPPTTYDQFDHERNNDHHLRSSHDDSSIFIDQKYCFQRFIIQADSFYTVLEFAEKFHNVPGFNNVSHSIPDQYDLHDFAFRSDIDHDLFYQTKNYHTISQAMKNDGNSTTAWGKALVGGELVHHE